MPLKTIFGKHGVVLMGDKFKTPVAVTVFHSYHSVFSVDIMITECSTTHAAFSYSQRLSITLIMFVGSDYHFLVFSIF